MKVKLLRQCPFQLTFLFVFTFAINLTFATNVSTEMFDLSDEETYSSTTAFLLGADDCLADAGTMSTEQPLVELYNGSAVLTASPNGDAVTEGGLSNIYVLTKGEELLIMDAGPSPEFTVIEPGSYTIHSLVFDANTLDLSVVTFGVTTGVDVLNLIVNNPGKICASLDVKGALFKVIEGECKADAGT